MQNYKMGSRTHKDIIGGDIMQKPTRAQVIGAASAVFAIAVAAGSTILTPDQREAILSALPAILSLFGL